MAPPFLAQTCREQSIFIFLCEREIREISKSTQRVIRALKSRVTAVYQLEIIEIKMV